MFKGYSNHEELVLKEFFAARGEFMKVHARFPQHSACRRSILFAMVLAMAVCLAAPFSGAQSTGGRIRGTVMDTSGGGDASPQVNLVNQATNATREMHC